MLACDKYKVFMPLIFTEPPSEPWNCVRQKTFFSFQLAIQDFHEQNYHSDTLTLYVANIGIDVIIIGVAQQQKLKFSLP